MQNKHATHLLQSTLYLQHCKYHNNSILLSSVPGFIEGWAGNEKCIAQTLENVPRIDVPGVPLTADQIKYYVNPEALKNAIVNGEVKVYLIVTIR